MLKSWSGSISTISHQGQKIEEFTIPFVLNGESVEGTWELWHAEWGWDYLAFRLKDPVKKGRVKFDVRHFLDAAGKALSNSTRVKDFENLYFTVWEIGTEFGSPETKARNSGGSLKTSLLIWR